MHTHIFVAVRGCFFISICKVSTDIQCIVIVFVPLVVATELLSVVHFNT